MQNSLNLKQIVFGIDENCFQIKLKQMNEDKILLQIIDVTDNVLYTKEKSQNMLLSLINATVSHELRNPLNSINA